MELVRRQYNWQNIWVLTSSLHVAKPARIWSGSSAQTRQVNIEGNAYIQVIDYRSENVGEVAKRSRYAPFAVVLDCVGGTEVIPCMEDLVLEDPQRPELGVYGSISGDRKCFPGKVWRYLTVSTTRRTSTDRLCSGMYYHLPCASVLRLI